MGTSVANLVFEWLADERLVVTYQSAREPTDAEWDAYLELVRALLGRPDVRVLAYSEGGRPSRDQQRRLTELACREVWPIAVVSGSIALRFVVSVFALETPGIRLFAPEQLEQACAYLACTTAETHSVIRAIERLKVTLEPGRKIAGARRHSRSGGSAR